MKLLLIFIENFQTGQVTSMNPCVYDINFTLKSRNLSKKVTEKRIKK